MNSEPSVANSTFSAAYTIGFSHRRNIFHQNTFHTDIFSGSDSPGPQAYQNIDLNVSKKKYPEWKISETKKTSMFDVTEFHPSPGNYEIQTSIGKGVSYTIQVPNNNEQEPSKPSPALYTPNTNFIKKTLPAISITSRMAPQIKKTFEETPGPGAYDTQVTDIQTQIKKKVTKGVHNLFGSAEKDSIYRKDSINNPAPNQYIINESNIANSPSFRFQRGKRTELINPSYEINGPGSYNVKRDFLQSKFQSNTPQNIKKNSENINQVMIKSMSEPKFDPNPGPGAYDHELPSLFNSSYFRATKFGQNERQTDLCKNDNTPGPGQYDAVFDHKELRSSKYNTFGESKKNTNLQKSLTPGPGSYNIPQQIGGGPKYGINKSISNQPSFIRKSESPGPGAYIISENQTRPSPFSVKFNSKTEGSDTYRSLIPGPGHYELPDDSFRKSKISFTTSAIREAFGMKNDGPSPASYDIKATIAGLPEYHKKQMDYFKNQIQTLRETMRDSKGLKLTSRSYKSNSTNRASRQSSTQRNYFQNEDDVVD